MSAKATRTKVYTDEKKNLDQLLAVIESEMGPEVSLDVKEFRSGGMLGVGGKLMVQITATSEVEVGPRRSYRLDENWSAGQPVQTQAPRAQEPAPAPTVPTAGPHAAPPPSSHPYETMPDTPRQQKKRGEAQTAPARPAASTSPFPEAQPAPQAPAPVVSTPAPGTTAQPAAASAVHHELGGLEDSIAELQTQVREMLVQQTTDTEKTSQQIREEREAAERRAERDALAEQVFEQLIDSNIRSRDARELVQAAMERGPSLDPAVVMERIAQDIAASVTCAGGIETGGGPRVAAFVGATDSGKTGTLCKVAALHSFGRDQKVSIISLDTYRIAAVEQLRKYCEITGLPLRVAYSPEDYVEALKEESGADLILVDTAGRSPLNPEQLHELARVFDARPPDEVHLVVPASTRADDLLLTTQAFAPVRYSRIVVSKIDETQGLGGLYNVARYGVAPISYLTTGQSVPEDIKVADKELISAWAEKAAAS